jgi:hypothetical protein
MNTAASSADTTVRVCVSKFCHPLRLRSGGLVVPEHPP